MKFSDTTLKNGIVQTMELLLDLGDTGITANPTLFAQMTNLINNDAYDDVIAEIMKNEGTFIWDDFNYGNANLPSAAQNLSVVVGSEVSTYALPAAASPGSTDVSSFLRLIYAEVKDASGYYQRLIPIDDGVSEAPIETIFNTPGFPKYYRLLGNSITLYPTPLASQVTAIAGLKFIFQRDKIDFAVGDTTKQPGFPSIYHYLLPLIASETWAAIKGMKQLGFITQKKIKFYQNLGWGIANRDKNQKQALRSIQSRRNNQYQ